MTLKRSERRSGESKHDNKNKAVSDVCLEHVHSITTT